MRVGLLGGSFNPAHEGHLHASLQALKQLKLDRVWWLVSPQNPLKPERGMARLDHRLGAARKLARDPRIIATTLEDELGTRYTVHTVAALQRHFPRVNFVWIMGTDNLVQLPRWRDWERLLRQLPVAVVARPGTALSARSSPAAQRFASARRGADARFALRRAPAIAILDGTRNMESATRLRRSQDPQG